MRQTCCVELCMELGTQVRSHGSPSASKGVPERMREHKDVPQRRADVCALAMMLTELCKHAHRCDRMDVSQRSESAPERTRAHLRIPQERLHAGEPHPLVGDLHYE